ncbi:hypothetical protein G5714_006583 [Onychostoma macrolepis]|uniref:Uncharacterized protein n=1 Tax=Onychostoma macrolepis TaxID=369639 RepID=A0A7J6CWQ3_9TELE|nr:hypothetical protein G5714_006583 [Onychostoma macrolepis]
MPAILSSDKPAEARTEVQQEAERRASSARSCPSLFSGAAQRTTFINYSGVAAQQRAEKVSLRTDGCRLSVLMKRRLEVDHGVSRHVNLHHVFVQEGRKDLLPQDTNGSNTNRK